jgi:putative transposase
MHAVQVALRVAVWRNHVGADGHREVLGCAVGDNETEAFWAEFLTDLRERGLAGVQLVVSDAHRGPVAAVGRIL